MQECSARSKSRLPSTSPVQPAVALWNEFLDGMETPNIFENEAGAGPPFVWRKEKPVHSDGFIVGTGSTVTCLPSDYFSSASLALMASKSGNWRGSSWDSAY